MNRAEFLEDLKNGLSGLPQDEIDERLSFYSEMIDDRIEEGASEEEAVAGIGNVSDIVSQTVADIPLTKLIKDKIKPNRTLKAWEIVLIVLGFPLWFPLLVAAGAIILSVYIVIWSIIVSLWAIEVSFVAAAIGGLVGSVLLLIQGHILPGFAMLGMALLFAGLSIFMFYGCLAASKGMVILTKKIALAIKSCFIKKENKE